MKLLMKSLFFLLFTSFMMTSCVTKKQFQAMQADYKTQLEAANKDLGKCGENLSESLRKISACEQDRSKLQADIKTLENSLRLRQEQMDDLKGQVTDLRSQRDKQLSTVTDLTNLSSSANQNIKETLSQLEKKDQFIHLLQAAKTRADSINLALAVNLKGVLSDGLADTIL